MQLDRMPIDFHQLAKPANLSNSAVLRMLEEEQQSGRGQGATAGAVHYLKNQDYLSGLVLTDMRENMSAAMFDMKLNRLQNGIKKEIKELGRRPSKKPPEWPPTSVTCGLPWPTWGVPCGHGKSSPGLQNGIKKEIKELGRRPSKKPPEWPPTSVTCGLPWPTWGVPCGHGKSSPGLKRVAWPPPPEEGEFIVPIDESAQTQLPQSFTPSSPRLQRRASPPPPPSTITLRTSQPVRQAAAPVYVSQPITASVQGGLRSRGDQKWPPESVKQASQAENEARIALAKGPAFRPRRVKKDYSTFFAQHALNSTYPGYKPPPGTQHYIEDGTSAL